MRTWTPKTMADENAVISLAHWIADLNYMKERCPDEVGEIERTKRNIEFSLYECDKAGVPWYMQNSIICMYEDYRTIYKQDIMTSIDQINARYTEGR